MNQPTINKPSPKHRVVDSSELRLCILNASLAWKNADGTYIPAVSVFSLEELRSGIPFFTENEPVRFSRHGNGSKNWAEVHALCWLARYNRRLENGLFDPPKRSA